MLDINLLPPDYKKEIEFAKDNRNKVSKVLSTSFVFILGLLLAASGFLYLNRQQNDALERSKGLDPQIAELKSVETEAKALNARLDTLKSIFTNHLYWTRLYGEIVEAKPGGVTLNEFVLNADFKKTQEITGTAPDIETVADYRSALESQKLIKSVTVKSATYGKNSNQRGYQFNFILTFENNALIAGKEATK